MTELLQGQEFENLIQALTEAGRRYLGLWYEEDPGQKEVIDSLLAGLSDDGLRKVSFTLNQRKEEWWKNRPSIKPGEYPGNPYAPIVSILYPERGPGGS